MTLTNPLQGNYFYRWLRNFENYLGLLLWISSLLNEWLTKLWYNLIDRWIGNINPQIALLGYYSTIMTSLISEPMNSFKILLSFIRLQYLCGYISLLHITSLFSQVLLKILSTISLIYLNLVNNYFLWYVCFFYKDILYKNVQDEFGLKVENFLKISPF